MKRDMEARTEALAARVFGSLEAAETRRMALIEAERERLRAEHELVLTRLVRGWQEGCWAQPSMVL